MVKEIHYFNTFLSKGKTFIDQKDLIKMLLDYKDRCNEEQKKVEKHDKNIKIIFGTIQKLTNPPQKPKIKIGFM